MGEIIAIKRSFIGQASKKKMPPDPEYDKIMWAIGGRSLDATKKGLCAVSIEPHKITATDGHILLQAQTEAEYPAGYYHVLMSTLKLIVMERIVIDYPDWHGVLTFTGFPPDQVTKLSTAYAGAISHFVYVAFQFHEYDLQLLQRAFFPCDNVTLEWRSSLNVLVVRGPQQVAVVAGLTT